MYLNQGIEFKKMTITWQVTLNFVLRSGIPQIRLIHESDNSLKQDRAVVRARSKPLRGRLVKYNDLLAVCPVNDEG